MNYVVRFVNSLENIDFSKALVGQTFYVLPNGDAYFYGANQLGGWLSSVGNFFQQNAGQIIATGAGVLSGLLNKPTSQAKGLAAITAFCTQLLQALDALAQQIGTAPKAAIDAEADRLVAMLSDHSVVYQAKNGSDAAVLRQAKEQAAAKRDQIKAATAAIEAQQQPPPNVPVGPGTTQPNDAASMFNSPMFVIAAALGLILILR